MNEVAIHVQDIQVMRVRVSGCVVKWLYIADGPHATCIYAHAKAPATTVSLAAYTRNKGQVEKRNVTYSVRRVAPGLYVGEHQEDKDHGKKV